LVATEPDGALGDYIALEAQLARIEELDGDAQENLLADLAKYCLQFPERGDVLALTTVDRLAKSGGAELALRIGNSLVEKSTDKQLWLPGTVHSVGTVRQGLLHGKPMRVTGRTMDGDEFKWENWRGKVALITFWFVGCRGCREDLPRLKKLYARYHEQGFDIVGISIDSELEAVRDYVKAEGITWTNLCQPGMDQPSAVHYSISKFPYHVLVDREGVVAALDPDMEKLPSMLEELIARPTR
jgi:peroxiredoxin